jgi:hypothetical protein
MAVVAAFEMDTLSPPSGDGKRWAIMMCAAVLPRGQCLEHRKSTKSEGWMVLICIVVTIVLTGVGQWFTFSSIWSRNKSFVVAFFTIEVFLAVAALCYATVNLLVDADFECRIDDNSISCLSPAGGCGESFSVPISEIVKIEKELWGDGDCRWYLWSVGGRRFWLTSNYDCHWALQNQQRCGCSVSGLKLVLRTHKIAASQCFDWVSSPL